MIKILISACLLGERVRYHGGDAALSDRVLDRWRREGRLVPFCPEVAGGLSVPRPPAEIRGAGGGAVLEGTARVVTSEGADVTEAFLAGARAALDAALRQGARVAILKDGSPSCATAQVYDGTFTGRRRPGSGVTAALLAKKQVRVFNEHELEAAQRYVAELESGRSSESEVQMTTVADGGYRERILGLIGDRNPLEAMEANSRRVEALARRLGEAGLSRSYGPGKWTGKQILAHLADAEIGVGFRIRQVLSQDDHRIQSFDEGAWARRYTDVDVESALASYLALRRWNLSLLRGLSPADLEREAFHPERGPETLGTIVRLLAGHDLNHLAQLERL